MFHILSDHCYCGYTHEKTFFVFYSTSFKIIFKQPLRRMLRRLRLFLLVPDLIVRIHFLLLSSNIYYVSVILSPNAALKAFYYPSNKIKYIYIYQYFVIAASFFTTNVLRLSILYCIILREMAPTSYN